MGQADTQNFEKFQSRFRSQNKWRASGKVGGPSVLRRADSVEARGAPCTDEVLRLCAELLALHGRDDGELCHAIDYANKILRTSDHNLGLMSRFLRWIFRDKNESEL